MWVRISRSRRYARLLMGRPLAMARIEPMFLGGESPRLNRQSLVAEVTEGERLAAHHDRCFPAPFPRYPADAYMPRCIVAAETLVLRIRLSRRQAKVFKTVVSADAVDVVDGTSWPLAGNKEPDQLMN